MPKQDEIAHSLTTVSPSEVWGKVITELRNRGLRLLFIACGEIDSVDLIDNKFIITAQENNKIAIDTPSNLNILKEIISVYIPNVEVYIQQEMVKQEIIPSPKLIELFGDKLIIGE